MAAIALGIAGTALGGAIGGTVLGISAAAIGGAIGAGIGSMVDSWVISQLFGPDTQRIEGPRLDAARITTSSEGSVIPRVFGRHRLGGNVIWATDFREEVVTERQGGGKGGGGSGTIETTTYLYYASFAVAVCEGPIRAIGRIWADGKPMDLQNVTWRLHRGTESQSPDPFIVSRSGPSTPAYRGTAYVVFEDLPLERFGNRIPQLTFEVFRPLADSNTAEGLVNAVTVIPASGEFIYATEKITRDGGRGETIPENTNATHEADFRIALDRLQASVPAIQHVYLVVSWFGDDLRAGHCDLRPGVEVRNKASSRPWSVNGVGRAAAHLVSRDDDDRPIYGGTPADFSVVQAIQECKRRGLRVTFYPFFLMDVPPGNNLPNPYSDNAASSEQPAFPWRGRITCSPAAGFAGTVDKTGAAASQIAAFFGNAARTDFAVSGTNVSYHGPTEWSWRRMMLHYAHLCAAAGGVDAFLIGSEMRGVTTVRSSGSAYPAVSHLITLAADCRAILGSGTDISYAADWSEYFGHQPSDGSGDVFFHLDPLWANGNIDFIGIDNYMPLSDWRPGFDHADAQEFDAIYQRDYLQSNIEGGEGFDWYYADAADRNAQERTPITDSAGKPWVFRYKDLRSWWNNRHYHRPGGIESGAPTAWVPQSKPFRFTEYGCPAVDMGPNQPNVFYDPKSSESFVPYFSRGWRDDGVQRAYLEATLLYWGDNANNPASSVYSGRMIQVADSAAWTWDARPYPWFPALADVWSDGANWRLGHWLNGRLGSVSLQALIRSLCERADLPANRIDVSGVWGSLEGYSISALESPRASLGQLARHFGFDAVESGGKIVFRMRGRKAAAQLELADLVAAEGERGDVIEFERAQETELPLSLKWTIARSDENYDAATVEARRRTADAARIVAESFPFSVPPEEAERRVNRALMEAWVGRETSSFRLPPSRLALDPSDVVEIIHDDRIYEFRLLSANDADVRTLTAMRQDRAGFAVPSGGDREVHIPRPPTFGPPVVAFLDVPQLRAEQAAHQPLLAGYAAPWPGALAVYRSPEEDGFTRLMTLTGSARLGEVAFDFYSGPTGRWDLGNELYVDLFSGTLQSLSDVQVLGGSNALAIESEPGVWEVVQFAEAELLAAGHYRLTRLLRGLRGTEGAMGRPTAAGARVVVLDTALMPVPLTAAEVGLDYNWRIGPSVQPHTDPAFVAQSFAAHGVGLRPFSGDHVRQPWRYARVPGDLAITWLRRTRALDGDNWEAIEIPLGEEAEAYEVDILDGASVLRTLSSASPSVVYTGAEQSSDWGAPLGTGAALDIVIYQFSPAYGRGSPFITTLHF
ncbi:glycoside hydrolase TIM-barrel-like domain-containing protein [Devosia sp. YIM 151766]|uniref:baseplate multidomain protein megatron n=1 Tax=Devosia sp. YIM 151766 TaxID=3017325 RepID=UPI00255C7C9B|nr:glycoside hydrolase TIM-barrel-like domain-containing protein [Devosia sp. YIM 151766]WIY52466.1 glycoside hydrolase TIM-barrel-like domain-containing protein [Devosia sp. YIM 151766]